MCRRQIHDTGMGCRYFCSESMTFNSQEFVLLFFAHFTVLEPTSFHGLCMGSPCFCVGFGELVECWNKEVHCQPLSNNYTDALANCQ